MTGTAEELAERMKTFIGAYNTEAYRHKVNPDADWPSHLKWSETLKAAALRGATIKFDEANIVRSLYRPFAKKWLYFDRLVNERVYQWPAISGRVLVISDVAWRAPATSALISDCIADLHLCAPVDAHQCFPLSHLKDSAVAQFRQHYSNESIDKEDVFNCIYALLHHPEYRERYADNLKRELPASRSLQISHDSLQPAGNSPVFTSITNRSTLGRSSTSKPKARHSLSESKK